MKNLVLALSAGAAFIISAPAFGEDINKIFENVKKLVAEEKFPAALKEIDWMKKEIEGLSTGQLKKLLPDSLLDYQGGSPETSAALGFSTLKRSYKNGAKTIEVQITSGSGGAGGAFGGMLGLGKMAAMMGVQGEGQDAFRIDGRTASLETSGDPKVSVFLDSGAVLAISGNGGIQGDELKKFAESMPVGKIDDYLKG